jgi:hemerythrin-like metal-binding protein
MKWEDELRLGYGPMDDVHEEFVALLDACQQARDADLPGLLQKLQVHTQSHFDQENQWMRETQFPPADCHVEQHDAVLASIAEVSVLLATGRVDVARSLLQALEEWFPQHASQLDSALAHWMFKRRFGGKPLLLRRAVRQP